MSAMKARALIEAFIKNLFTSRPSAMIPENSPFKNETSVVQPTSWKTKFSPKTMFKKYSAVYIRGMAISVCT